jgi:hypothetical protein
MSVTPPHIIEAIDRDIRETSISFKRLAAKYRVAAVTVRKRAYAMEPGSYPQRLAGHLQTQISPELQMLGVAMHLDGKRNYEIAERIGCHPAGVTRLLRRHRDTIEAAREEAAPKSQIDDLKHGRPDAKSHSDDLIERWIAEGFDEPLARFMASNRPRLLRVSEGV